MRTHLIATIGPSSDDPKILNALVKAGMTIARINASHATPQEIRRRTKLLRTIAAKHKKKLKIMLDLQGPRLRVGVLPQQGRVLVEGETVLFDTNGSTKRGVIHIDDPYLHSDIQAGHPLFLSSGQMELVVTKVAGTQIETKVVRGGHLFSRKGVNVPGTTLTTSGLTDKDRQDVKYAIEAGVDLIALSFVQSVKDIQALRDLLPKKIGIIAKIEMAVVLQRMEEVFQASDGIMVARGDLGIELPPEEVPFVQKSLVRQAMWHNKPSIVATQMLISMTDHPHPTRAEVSDVANAVMDGADAVMLSDETASGSYPVEAVTTMAKIIARTERERIDRPNPFNR